MAGPAAVESGTVETPELTEIIKGDAQEMEKHAEHKAVSAKRKKLMPAVVAVAAIISILAIIGIVCISKQKANKPT